MLSSESCLLHAVLGLQDRGFELKKGLASIYSEPCAALSPADHSSS